VTGRRGALESILGAVLLAAGLGLLVTAGYWLYDHSRLEEPASPGKTPNPSSKPFFRPFEEMTEAELDRMNRQELEELREQGRHDALMARIQLYAVGPGGLLLVVIGVWLLIAAPRRQSPANE